MSSVIIVAQISTKIPNPFIAGMVYWLFLILVVGICVAGTGILAILIEIKVFVLSQWSYVKKKYKLNVTNFPFFVIVNSLSLLRPFPSFSDIVPHIHLETNIHNDYEYGLYYRMFQYIQKLVYMHECS